MSNTYNIYCDESCHLENDGQKAMVLGALVCPLADTHTIAEDIRQIKTKHGLKRNFEIKWTKVSPKKLAFYRELIDYFYDCEDLSFRALIVPDKSLLQHEEFRQDHDTWYYKMYFDMLKIILRPGSHYRIYLDMKDTRSAAKTAKLWEVLRNNVYDFQREIIERVQLVHSHEVEQIQLADLLIGIISSVNRSMTKSKAKLALMEQMKQRSGYSLTRSTLLRESKVNLFRWHASGGE